MVQAVNKAEKFLKEHKMRAEDVNIQAFVDEFTSDMVNGLNGKDSTLRMIPTYIEADNKFLTDIPVMAIDAGGTNFRTAVVKFNSTGKLEISHMLNAGMPGLDGVISKTEFFDVMAGYVRTNAEKSERIGFCFSYPTEILPDKDGILLQFCKEVQAPGVIGQLIGKNLLKTLGMPEKPIVLLNDTVATLLAGKSASFDKNYDSFIGYILGTGTNACYIEKNSNIKKKHDLDPGKTQIINIESGGYRRIKQSDLDIVFDKTTVNPGDYKLEKMISGGYLGGLCLVTLKAAASEGLFSEETKSGILTLNDLSAEEVNKFVANPGSGATPLHKIVKDVSDSDTCIKIIEGLISRAAKLVAGNLASVILKTEKGKSPERPVLITVDGTIYYKLHNLRPQIDKYLMEYLKGDKKRYVEFMEVKNSSLVGAALAALIN
jgi:hexokinase